MCSFTDVDSVPEHVTREIETIVESVEGGLSDMYQDWADDARDDY